MTTDALTSPACTPARRCHEDGCRVCQALPCHYPVTVDGPHYQPSCELGAGFTYWNLRTALPIGSLGHTRTASAAATIAAAYNDPNATRESVRIARAMAR